MKIEEINVNVVDTVFVIFPTQWDIKKEELIEDMKKKLEVFKDAFGCKVLMIPSKFSTEFEFVLIKKN